MAGPTPTARRPHVCGGHPLLAGRPRRAEPGGRPRPERRSHQQGGRCGRQNPRRRLGAWGDDPRRRSADRGRSRSARRSGPDRGDCRRADERPQCPPLVGASGSGTVRPGRGRRPGGRGNRSGRSGLPRRRAVGACRRRFAGGPPRVRDRSDGLARIAARSRAADRDPAAAAEVESATRRRARHAVSVGHRDARRIGHATPIAGGGRGVRRGTPRRGPERPAHRGAWPIRRRRRDRHRLTGPATGRADERTDHRHSHRADRTAVHRPVARGHAARTESDRPARRPQRHRPPTARRGRQDHLGSVSCGDDRQPRRLVHPGHRTQRAATGVA